MEKRELEVKAEATEKKEAEVKESELLSQEEEIIERPYTLRRLKNSDLFLLIKMLKKIGIKDFKEAFIQVASGDKTIKEIGILTAFDIADILIGNLPKIEDDVYEMWSNLSGIPAVEIPNMEFGTLPLMIMDTFKEERNTSFFKVLSKLLS